MMLFLAVCVPFAGAMTRCAGKLQGMKRCGEALPTDADLRPGHPYTPPLLPFPFDHMYCIPITDNRIKSLSLCRYFKWKIGFSVRITPTGPGPGVPADSATGKDSKEAAILQPNLI
ncbi:hypothetical protein QBC39DRAFT_2860 [Podospora conica]|nr:hypothetical protein QBC39DRAFT_2860 [Schizothecium conicum]